ncbi:hypothetical protein ACHAXT_009690 [Thalassiosira profunda]
MIYDAVIVGGGVVGLSILRACLLAGHAAVLLERHPDLCDGASGRNSGVLCTGVDAPAGSLERALIRDSISRVREFCRKHNVPMRECGSLVCLWPWDGEDAEEKKAGDDAALEEAAASKERLRRVLEESHVAGDKDASFLDAEEVARVEPSLSSQCRGAVHIPGETVVDPWLFPLALAAHARELAEASIRTGREVVMERSSFDRERGVWNVVTRATNPGVNGDGDETTTITARCVINAAGIHSDLVQMSAASSVSGNGCTLPPPTFEARPRRGQYRIFAAPNDGRSNSQWPNVPRSIPVRPIQPVPSQFTKGIFVYSTLYDQIVVGPTSDDQSSRTDDALDGNVADQLTAHASRVLGPQFDHTKVVGEYVGIRPGTSKRDYQIHLHPPAHFITVGGIRSTGLTASLGIGRHVVQCLLATIVPPKRDDSSPDMQSPPTPLPDVNELVMQYHRRRDGKVAVGGHVYRVTHPLTRMGWDARTGLAAR